MILVLQEAIYRFLNFVSDSGKISFLDTNFTFTLPFHGLNHVTCKKELDPIFTQIRRFYFGHAKINGSQILPFMQLASFTNLAYLIQKEVAIQALSKSSAEIRLLRFDLFFRMKIVPNCSNNNFCFEFDGRINLRTLLSLSLNRPGVAALAGTSHIDDLCSYFW